MYSRTGETVVRGRSRSELEVLLLPCSESLLGNKTPQQHGEQGIDAFFHVLKGAGRHIRHSGCLDELARERSQEQDGEVGNVLTAVVLANDRPSYLSASAAAAVVPGVE